MDLGAAGGDLEIMTRDGESLGRHLVTVTRDAAHGWIGAAWITGIEWDGLPHDELVLGTEQGLLTMKVQQISGGNETATGFLLVLIEH